MTPDEVRNTLGIPDYLPVADGVLAALESVPVPQSTAELAEACMTALAAAGQLGTLPDAGPPARPARRRY